MIVDSCATAGYCTGNIHKPLMSRFCRTTCRRGIWSFLVA
ncbi:MAG TPA: hypothetical protein ENN50_08735 [Prosthecochloris aestuarii]|uniref:Uncharacterized protein n=1 Tax=Prosthecochloris aestuarii TaxID=1102 RepID=A0A831SU52_PROAE|nr:hypothetical protein [Prosthecochloris sp.]HED31742.1 hypothetical protein [Prosthecochloris aestuarii]